MHILANAVRPHYGKGWFYKLTISYSSYIIYGSKYNLKDSSIKGMYDGTKSNNDEFHWVSEKGSEVQSSGTKWKDNLGAVISNNSENNEDNYVNLFTDKIIIEKNLKTNKVFSIYTNSYIPKESEHILILSLKKLKEYEKIKDKVKLSVYIYELQNLSKSKISFNVLKKIEIINNLFEHINANIEHASPSLLLSTSISYKRIHLNKYTYFKNILRAICNNIKVHKSNKLSKLLINEDRSNKDDYQYTIELLKKEKKKNKNKINMVNVYTNHLNNSALCYILYSYSTLFTTSNAYVLYICKYILLNVGNLNCLDMLSLLYYIRRSNVKVRGANMFLCRSEGLSGSFGSRLRRSSSDSSSGMVEGHEQNHFDKAVDELSSNKLKSQCKSINSFTMSDEMNRKAVKSRVIETNHKGKYDEYKNTYMKILRTIIHLINKRKIFLENSNISVLILYYYFKMNFIPIQIFYKFHYKIKKNIKKIDIKYLSLYLYILSSIKFDLGYYKFIYKYLTSIFQNREKEFNMLSLCLSFYSLSKNGYYDETFVRCCVGLFRTFAGSLNNVNITNIIYTLGKLKIRDEELLDILCDILMKRQDNISAINLSLTVHNLSKLNYKNEIFFKMCLEKGKELLSTFTTKQLVIFGEGMIINNTYDYEFMQVFFNQLIEMEYKDTATFVNNNDMNNNDMNNNDMNSNYMKNNHMKNNNNIKNTNYKKKHILSTICFSLALERENFVNQFPLSIKTFISKNLNNIIQSKSISNIHDEIVSILNYLNIENFEIVKQKKPYVFDIFIKGDQNIYIDILSPCKYLTNSVYLNGFIELKKRHMKLLNANYYYFNKKNYLSLESLDEKIIFIKNFLQNVCSYNFNYVNKMKEEKKKEIQNFLLLNANEHGHPFVQIYYEQNGHQKKGNITNDKKSSIKNRDYYLLPSYANVENIKKKIFKKKMHQINFEQPLIKKQQIFIHYDDDALLNRSKMDLLNTTMSISDSNILYDEEQAREQAGGKQSPIPFKNDFKEKFLFKKKCHGLSKWEYFDERTGKIIIKKRI
ncbi:conserved Plasmodium protein, unknown function [Plasmodium malariae]|uniref:Uncharacterized protein n=1 Tax=Plasmodium malariae TaxID=5858 RepID=A0A1D3SP81_PLAMA|nr:conserved Plasmodium protein, unknown function [Plasmodium malariae]SCO93195.1 conserved Plasmodium protein, unknown function [Plasmodium malariae]